MRFLLPVALSLLLAVTAAHAQYAAQQNMSFADRLDFIPRSPKATPELLNAMNGKAFQGAGSYELRDASAKQKTFDTKSFSSKSFTTRSFLGVKNPWFGNKVYTTDSANLSSRFADTYNQKKFAANDAKVKGFQQTDKHAPVTETPVETYKSSLKGNRQTVLDQQTRPKLSLEQVRELLNKNQ